MASATTVTASDPYNPRAASVAGRRTRRVGRGGLGADGDDPVEADVLIK